METITAFVNRGSDLDILKSMYDSNPTEDLEKALKKEGLTLMDVEVKGKHGVYHRKQWVKIDKNKKDNKSHSTNSSSSDDKSKKLNSMATTALKYDDDEEWTCANEQDNWKQDGDKDREKQIKKVANLLGTKDLSKVKITHGDNAENDDKFTDFYSALQKLKPVSTVPYGTSSSSIKVYDVGGKRYATEYSEGGGMAIYHLGGSSNSDSGNLSSMATTALKYDDDEEWTASDVMDTAEGDPDREKQIKEVASLLGAKNLSKVKVTHGDNSENGEEFSDFFDKLQKLTPTNSVPYGKNKNAAINVYDVGGKRYATESSEGGGIAIYHIK